MSIRPIGWSCQALEPMWLIPYRILQIALIAKSKLFMLKVLEAGGWESSALRQTVNENYFLFIDVHVVYN